MPHTALPLQHSEYSLFPPSVFSEALHYSAYAPPAPAEPAAPSPKRRFSKKASPEQLTRAKRRGRPTITQTNSLKPYLQDYTSPGHALAKLPKLGDIVTGAVSLDYGDNTKPLSIKTALVLLRRLDVISAESILDYMRLSLRPCSKRHAQRLAQCIRIIERASRAAKSEWPAPGQVDESDPYAMTHNIVPCSEQGCSICRSSAKVEQAWSLVAAEQDDRPSTSMAEDFKAFNDDEWAALEDDLFASD